MEYEEIQDKHAWPYVSFSGSDDDWMPEPCRSCDEKEKDFGGCRCQAFMLTGSADNADPVCSKSPHHHKILEARREAACSDIKVSQLQFRNRTRSQLIFQTRDL